MKNYLRTFFSKVVGLEPAQDGRIGSRSLRRSRASATYCDQLIGGGGGAAARGRCVVTQTATADRASRSHVHLNLNTELSADLCVNGG